MVPGPWPLQHAHLSIANAVLGCAAVLLLSACGSGGGAQTSALGFDIAAATTAVDALNYYRTLAGVQNVQLDYDLSRDCQRHADFLKLNGIDLRSVGLDAHREDPDLPYYSPEGDEAGRSSVIYQGVMPREAVDNWMCTLYHRLGLLDPNLLYVGFGSAGGYQVMDISRGRVRMPYAAPGVALAPPPGIKDAPRQYKREIPHPIPGDETLGVPISVEFFGAVAFSIREVQAVVADEADGTLVDCYTQWPGRPFLPEWDLAQLIVLIPREPLQKGHHYRVTISAMVDQLPWEADWSFQVR